MCFLDGCAIAHGVSKYLLNRGSRTIFSTHYHELMREYVKEPNVVIYHMSVLEQVNFIDVTSCLNLDTAQNFTSYIVAFKAVVPTGMSVDASVREI